MVKSNGIMYSKNRVRNIAIFCLLGQIINTWQRTGKEKGDERRESLTLMLYQTVIYTF